MSRRHRPSSEERRPRSTWLEHASHEAPLCESGKLRYASRKQAKAAAKARRRAARAGVGVEALATRPYRCRCGYWHLTSRVAPAK